MATKEQELIDGCFAHAAMDEPLFVLKATDELAPTHVRDWARNYLRVSARESPPSLVVG